MAHAADAPPGEDGARDGIDVLLALAGPDHGPAVILAAMLLALGERARIHSAHGATLVRVRIGPRELEMLPPHATLAFGAGYYLVLDPRRARCPLGFVPLPLRREMVDTLSAAS